MAERQLVFDWIDDFGGSHSQLGDTIKDLIIDQYGLSDNSYFQLSVSDDEIKEMAEEWTLDGLDTEATERNLTRLRELKAHIIEQGAKPGETVLILVWW